MTDWTMRSSGPRGAERSLRGIPVPHGSPLRFGCTRLRSRGILRASVAAKRSITARPVAKPIQIYTTKCKGLARNRHFWLKIKE
jgi:hypothetical protein